MKLNSMYMHKISQRHNSTTKKNKLQFLMQKIDVFLVLGEDKQPLGILRYHY